jgi:hypothetical protein
MGKVIIEFDSIEEQREIDDAMNGWRWKATLHDLDQELRSVTKHGFLNNRQATNIEVEIYDRIRDMIREKMADNDLAGRDLI